MRCQLESYFSLLSQTSLGASAGLKIRINCTTTSASTAFSATGGIKIAPDTISIARPIRGETVWTPIRSLARIAKTRSSALQKWNATSQSASVVQRVQSRLQELPADEEWRRRATTTPITTMTSPPADLGKANGSRSIWYFIITTA